MWGGFVYPLSPTIRGVQSDLQTLIRNLKKFRLFCCLRSWNNLRPKICALGVWRFVLISGLIIRCFETSTCKFFTCWDLKLSYRNRAHNSRTFESSKSAWKYFQFNFQNFKLSKFDTLESWTFVWLSIITLSIIRFSPPINFQLGVWKLTPKNFQNFQLSKFLDSWTFSSSFPGEMKVRQKKRSNIFGFWMRPVLDCSFELVPKQRVALSSRRESFPLWM